MSGNGVSDVSTDSSVAKPGPSVAISYQRALEVLERQGLSEHPHSTALKANLATLDHPATTGGRIQPSLP